MSTSGDVMGSVGSRQTKTEGYHHKIVVLGGNVMYHKEVEPLTRHISLLGACRLLKVLFQLNGSMIQ